MANILLVYHNLAERINYEKIIRSWGHKVVAVDDGWDAFEAIEQEAFDIAILEQSTTGITTNELCIKLKSNPNTFPIMLIVLTQQADLANRKQLYRAGCENVVPIPLDIEELKFVIDKLVRAHQETTGAESKLKLIQGMTLLLKNLQPELQPADYSQVISYTHTMSLKMHYSAYQRQLFLESIKLCSYYIMAADNSNIITSIDNFISIFTIGQWLKPSLHYIRCNSLHHSSPAFSHKVRDEAVAELKKLGFYPLAQLGCLVITFQELLNQGMSKTEALQTVKLLAAEKDFDTGHIKQLNNIIIAEEIFNDI